MRTVQNSTDLVRTYLKEIGKVPLLTHEEEIVLGKQVQRLSALEAQKRALEETAGYELSLEQWAEAVDLPVDNLALVVRQGNLAKRKMVEANLRLVVSVAKKYIKRNVDLLDLIQEGTIGMQRGVEKLTPLRAIVSRPTPTGGFAKPLPVPLPRKAALSGCPSTLPKSSTSLRKPSAPSLSTMVERPPSPNWL